MKTSKTETPETNTNLVQVQAQVQVFLSRDGDSLIHLLPGNGKIEMPLNFYKKLFGAPYNAAPKRELAETRKVYGFVARPAVYFSRGGDYLIHRVPGFKVVRSANYYRKVLGIEFTPAASLADAKKAQA